jgi:hypothetical protein
MNLAEIQFHLSSIAAIMRPKENILGISLPIPEPVHRDTLRPKDWQFG